MSILIKIKLMIKKWLQGISLNKTVDKNGSQTSGINSVQDQSIKNENPLPDNASDYITIENEKHNKVLPMNDSINNASQQIEFENKIATQSQLTDEEDMRTYLDIVGNIPTSQISSKFIETIEQDERSQEESKCNNDIEYSNNISSVIDGEIYLLSESEKHESIETQDKIDKFDEQENIKLNPEEMRERDKKRLLVSEGGRNNFEMPYILTAFGTKKYENYKRIVELLNNKLAVGLKQYGNQFLLGFIMLNDEDYCTLKEMFRILISNHKNKIEHCTSMLVSVAMVEIISREMNNDDYWGSIFNAAQINETQDKCNFLKECLLSFILRHNLYFHYTPKRRNYCLTMAVHSIFNNTNAINYFDFINDIYIEDLLETYDDELAREYIKKLISSIEYDLSKENNLSDSQVSKISGLYQLTFGQKYSFICSPKALTDSVANTLYNINSLNFNKKSFKMEPMKFYYGFKMWQEHKFMEKTKEEREDIIRASKKGIVKRFFKAYYSIDKDWLLYINIPEQKIDIRYAYDTRLNIYIDDVLSKELSTTLKVYGKIEFKTEVVSIRIDGFYKNVRYEICSGDIVLYNSRDLLYRDFIICSKDFDEIKVNRIPQEHIYLITPKDADVAIDDFYNKYNCSNYSIYSIDPSESCSVTVNGSTLTAFELEKQSLMAKLIDSETVTNAKIVFNSVEYDIFNNLKTLRIHASDLTPDEIVVQINDINYLLTDMIGSKQETSGNRVWSVSMNLDSALIPYGKPVIMNIRRRGESKLYFSTSFIVLRNFKIDFEKDIYYNDRTGKIEYIYSDDLETSGVDFTKVYNLSERIFTNIPVKIGDADYDLLVYFPVIYWEIDGLVSVWSNIKDIFALDLYENPELKVWTPFYRYDLLLCGSTKVEILKEDRNNTYNLKNYIHLNEEYVTIGIIDKQSQQQYKLFDIYYKPTLKNISAEYIPYKKVINFSCYPMGNCTAKVEIVNESDGHVLTSYELNAGKTNAVIPFESGYGRFLLKVYCNEEDDFGFGLRSRLISSAPLIVGDILLMEAEKGVISIDEFIDYQKKRYRIPNFHLKDITPVNEGKYYTASAFYYRKCDDDIIKWYYTNANPVYVNIIMKDENHLELEIFDKDMDGFIFDRDKSYILFDECLKGDQLTCPDYYIIKLR